MPPKKKAAAVKKPAAVSKKAIAKVVKKQGTIAAKATPASGSRSGTKSNSKSGSAKVSVKAAKSPAKKAPAAKSPAKKAPAAKSPAAKAPAAKAPAAKAPAKKAQLKRTTSSNVTVAAGHVQNLVPDTHIYVEGSTVWACDLSLIDAAINSDKYYNMRVLQADHSNAVFEDTFKRKTGCAWEASFTQKKGKYNFVKKDYGLVRNSAISWEYELTNDPLSKPDGWYPYDGDVTTAGSAMAHMEEYWEQFQANAWLDTRFVESGQWTYKVDYNAMEQTNTKSNKTRPIRRV